MATKGGNKMFGRNKMKYTMLAVFLVLSACSKQSQYSANAYTTSTSTSCTSVSSTTSYRGDFAITETGSTGYIQLAIINSTAATSSTIKNFTATGLLVFSGNQYCCTTTGATGTLSTDTVAIAIGGGAYTAAITSLSLTCYAIGGSTSYYNSSSSINVTMPVALTAYGFPYTYITTGNRLEGYMRISSNYSSALPALSNMTTFIN